MGATSRFTPVLMVLAAAVFAVPGCKSKGGGEGAGTSGNIVVGEFASMTGSEATFGKSTDNGVQLAVEEINAAGGVNGRKVSVPSPEDTQSTASNGEIAAQRLVAKNAVAVIGEVASSGSLAAAPVCQRNGIPMITPASTNPKVTQVGDYIFRVCFTDDFQAAVVARFAMQNLKAKTAAVFYDSGQAYSEGFKTEFEKAFQAAGGKIVDERSYSKDDKDFSAALTRIKPTNPDVILVPGYYTQIGPIVKQARALGINVPLLGGDGWDSEELFVYAGNDTGACFFSDHMSAGDPNPTVQQFVKAYRAKYNKTPDALAALGYDAMKLLADAMKRAKSLKGPDLRDAIASTKDFDGVTGRITINAKRDADKSAVIIQASNGKFTYVTRIGKGQ